MNSINKSRKRKPYDNIRVVAIKAASQKFKVTESYIRMIINKTVNYGQADEIVKFYNEKYAEVKSIIK